MRKARALTADRNSSITDPNAICTATRGTPLFVPDPAKASQTLSKRSLQTCWLTSFKKRKPQPSCMFASGRSIAGMRWEWGRHAPTSAERFFIAEPVYKKWLCAQERHGRAS